MGTLSWTSRGILLSRLGTLSNCRGEAKEVATKQEKMKNIILVDVRRDCVSGRSVEEIKYNVLSLVDFPSTPKSRQHACLALGS